MVYVCVCAASLQNTVYIKQTHTYNIQFAYKGYFIGNEGIWDGFHNFKGCLRVKNWGKGAKKIIIYSI